MAITKITRGLVAALSVIALTGCTATSAETAAPQPVAASAAAPPQWFSDMWEAQGVAQGQWECQQWAMGEIGSLVDTFNRTFTDYGRNGYVAVTVAEVDAWMQSHCKILEPGDRDRPL